MIKKSIVILFCIVFCLFSNCLVFADARDDEIRELKKMVKSLTARIEKLEKGQQTIKEEAVKAAEAKAVKVSGVPAWTEKIKLKGDVRYRNEYQRPGRGNHFYRQRVRARAGIEARITDTVKGGIGIATGSSGDNTGRSTNATLGGEFGSYDLNMDYAYIQWRPVKEINLVGGKFKNPVYAPGDLLWDSDIRFDGAANKVVYDLGMTDLDIDAEFYLNSGFFIIDFLGRAEENPYLAVVQGGVGSSFEDVVEWKAFIGYLDFINIQNTASPGLIPAANSGLVNSEGKYAVDFNVLEINGEVVFHFLEDIDLDPIDKLFTLFGDLAWNTTGGTDIIDGDDTKSYAWEIGAKLGRHPESLGEWMALYNYKWMGRTSFPEEFIDADFAGGRTNAFGHEVILKVGLAKNWWLEFDYYAFMDKTTQGPIGDNDDWGQIVQADVNVKF